MADENVHEFQLTAKQLVFVFMSAVVVLVVVFLCGVSVGRGVRGAAAPAAASADGGAPGDTTVPATPAPGTPAASAGLTYHDALQSAGATAGDAARPAVVPPTSPGDGPPAAGSAGAAPPAAPPPAAKPVPDKTAASDPVPGKPAPGESAAFFLQIGAFSTPAAADRQLKLIKAKKYPASVFAAPAGTPGPRYHVQVGPYATRADAQRVEASLRKDGYKPLIQKR
jgi:DedD protein